MFCAVDCFHLLIINVFLYCLSQVISGRRHVGIMSAEPIGNYGVRYHDAKWIITVVGLVVYLLVIKIEVCLYGSLGYSLMTCTKREYIHGTISIILEVTGSH